MHTELIELDDCVIEVMVRRRGSLLRRVWRWLTRRSAEWTARVALLSGHDRGEEWWTELRARLVRAAIAAGGRVSRVTEG